MSGGSSNLVTVLSVVSPVLVALFGWLGARKLNQVHQEVKTGNGKTLADLATLQEGRRIIDARPAGEQTAAERSYVENVRSDDAKSMPPGPPSALDPLDHTTTGD